MLPSNAKKRKEVPLARGLLDYFPDALAVVAEVSFQGNEQHHPGAPLHWDKSKSTDEADALLRHLLDRGTLDTDGLRHTGKVAWRALALLQRELDAEAKREAEADPLIDFDLWVREQEVRTTLAQLNHPLGPQISMATAMERMGVPTPDEFMRGRSEGMPLYDPASAERGDSLALPDYGDSTEHSHRTDTRGPCRACAAPASFMRAIATQPKLGEGEALPRSVHCDCGKPVWAEHASTCPRFIDPLP